VYRGFWLFAGGQLTAEEVGPCWLSAASHAHPCSPFITAETEATACPTCAPALLPGGRHPRILSHASSPILTNTLSVSKAVTRASFPMKTSCLGACPLAPTLLGASPTRLLWVGLPKGSLPQANRKLRLLCCASTEISRLHKCSILGLWLTASSYKKSVADPGLEAWAGMSIKFLD